jgi:hypothetical protein
MAIADEVSALAARMGNRSVRDQYLQKVGAYRRITKSYRACFLDADGNLTEAGADVLGNLGAIAGIGKARRGRTAEEIQYDEGARDMVLHIMRAMHLDQDFLERIARKLRENRSNG